MDVILTNKGTTPLPVGTGEAGGYENLLPPGLDIFFSHEVITTLIFGEQPDPAGRNKLDALAIDPASPLAIEYGTDIDQWKGRNDPTAEEATMDIALGVKNVGLGDVTITTTEGDVVLKAGEGVVLTTLAGAKLVGQPYVPPPDPGTTVSILSFTDTLDPVCTVADISPLDAGDNLTLTATGGDPDVMEAINGYTGMAYNLVGNTFQLSGIDLTGVNVVGLTATASIAVLPDLTGTITAFTAADPTEASMDAEDLALVSSVFSITMTALTGDVDAMAYINGQSVIVLSVGATAALDIDLTGLDVTGLTADFVLDV